AVSLKDGLDPDAMDVTGALSADALTAADLAAGRWDGAALRLFVVDWSEPEGDQLLLARGELGAVSIEDNRFTAELKGPAAQLAIPVAELTSPDCRADLGDERCRVDLAPLVTITEIAAVIDDTVIDVAAAGGPANGYGYGRLRWIGGANSGLAAAILRSDGNRISLREAPAFAAAVGDRVELTRGCDKIFATCRDRFANSENFRGEPHLPGNDLLTRYPGAG
ncbi:MAG: DUF2163 domain-containing protein, partial [Parasphingopyxis sp.]